MYIEVILLYNLTNKLKRIKVGKLKEISHFDKFNIVMCDLGMIEYGKNGNTSRYAIVRCTCCKKEKKIRFSDIKKWHNGECRECRLSKSHITHNLTDHRLYQTWNGMIQRCTNIKSNNYKNYGEKGVVVCKRWEDIRNFIEDMYPTYQEGLSLDRINPYGNYEPSNCRWTTKEVQGRNTRLIISSNTSGYRGVCKVKNNKYQAAIKVCNKSIYLGVFNDIISAAKAYDSYVLENKLEHTINSITSYKE